MSSTINICLPMKFLYFIIIIVIVVDVCFLIHWDGEIGSHTKKERKGLGVFIGSGLFGFEPKQISLN